MCICEERSDEQICALHVKQKHIYKAHIHINIEYTVFCLTYLKHSSFDCSLIASQSNEHSYTNIHFHTCP